MNVTTLAARGSAALVALVAGYSSFSHIAHVALRYGERAEVAYALPFAIDGLLVVSTMAMIEDKRAGRRVRLSARVAFAFGVLASLGANIASAQPSVGARVVASIPAISLLLAVEVLSRSGRRTASVVAVADAPPSTASAPVTVSAEAPTVVAPAPAPVEVPDNVPTPPTTRERIPPSWRRRLAHRPPRSPHGRA